MVSGIVKPVNIVDEMQGSYLDYAMSVIVSRALPDVRDGLKPVHRRILYAMNDMGLRASGPHRKSARIVGEVLGKYHPHGDASVYDAMVRMAQEFSMRYPLVDGQGNFGSVDGDGAAAMRYTEARMTPIATEIMTDLEKDTVDMMPNYDETRQEPKVLPGKFPNLFSFDGRTKGKHTPQEVEEAIYRIIESVKNEPVPEKDLERAKKQLRAQYIRMLTSNDFMAYLLAATAMMLSLPAMKPRFTKSTP